MDRIHQSMSWKPAKDQQSSHENAEDQPREHTTKDASGWSADHPCLDASTYSRPVSFRSFVLPLHYTPSYNYPLIVWLHSNGFNENQVERVMPYVSLRNYVAVGIRAPKAADAMGHRFDWHSSPAGIGVAHDGVAEAIEEASRRFSIDQQRIVLAGYREGGTMALRIAMRQPERFAGAVSLGGRMPTGAIRNLEQLRRKRLAMLWQWATDGQDVTERLSADCRAALAIAAKVEIRQYPGDDEMDTVILRDVDQWIMNRIVSTSSSDPTAQRWASSPVAYSVN